MLYNYESCIYYVIVKFYRLVRLYFIPIKETNI